MNITKRLISSWAYCLLAAGISPCAGADTDAWLSGVSDQDDVVLEQRVARYRAVVQKSPNDTRARDGLADACVSTALASEVARALGDEQRADAKLQFVADRLSDTLWRVENRAGKGDEKALVALGVFQAYGVVVERDMDRACKAWRRAADAKNALGQYRAALCAAEKDERISVSYMRGAADQGHPAAQQSLAEVCMALDPPNWECAARWASASAVQGRVSAQGLVGWLHFSGQSTGLTDAQALAFLEAAAESGDTVALNNLGQVLESGAGGEARMAEAAQWYERAAKAGFPPAQYNLGRLYAVGIGREPNLAQARLWLTLAEDGGVAQAGEMLEWLTLQEDPESGD